MADLKPDEAVPDSPTGSYESDVESDKSDMEEGVLLDETTKASDADVCDSKEIGGAGDSSHSKNNSMELQVHLGLNDSSDNIQDPNDTNDVRKGLENVNLENQTENESLSTLNKNLKPIHDQDRRETTKVETKGKSRISLDDVGELDFDESSEEGEEEEDRGKWRRMQETPPKNEAQQAGSEDGEVCGESDDDDYEEGEIKSSDEDTSSPDEDMLRQVDPGYEDFNDDKQLCRFFQRGICHFGLSCRFLHPGVTDGPQGPGLHAPGPPVPWMGEEEEEEEVKEKTPELPSPKAETAWERGLRHAKKMRELAKQRREKEKDFEEKRLHIKPAPLPDAPKSPKVEKKDPEKTSKDAKKQPKADSLYEDASEDEYYDKSAIDPWKHDMFEQEQREPWPQYPPQPAAYTGDYDERYNSRQPPPAQMDNEFWDKARGGPADMGRGRRGDQWLDPWQRAKPQRRSRSHSRKRRDRKSYSSSSYSSRSGSSSSFSSRSSSSSSSHSSSSRSTRRSRGAKGAVKPKTKKPDARNPVVSKPMPEKSRIESPVKSLVSRPAPTENKVSTFRAEAPASVMAAAQNKDTRRPPPTKAETSSVPDAKKKQQKDKPPANYRRHRRRSSSSSSSGSSRSRSSSGHSSRSSSRGSSHSSRSSSSRSSRSRSSSGSADSDHLYRNIRRMPRKADEHKGKDSQQQKHRSADKASTRTPASPPLHKKTESSKAAPRAATVDKHNKDPKVIPLNANVRGMYSHLGMPEKSKSSREQGNSREDAGGREHRRDREEGNSWNQSRKDSRRDLDRETNARDSKNDQGRGRERYGRDSNKDGMHSMRDQRGAMRDSGRGQAKEYSRDQSKNYWEQGRDKDGDGSKNMGRDQMKEHGESRRDQTRQRGDDFQRSQHRDERSRKDDQQSGWQMRSSDGYRDRKPDVSGHHAKTLESKDPLKSSGQKAGIKLTLKDKPTEPSKGSKRPAAASPAGASPVKKSKVSESTKLEETRTVTITKPSATKPTATKPAAKKKTVSSRREELLQQLKAVEDAIQRKKKKLN